MSMITSEMQAERRELLAFLHGKTIAGMRFDEGTASGDFDLIFTDGSELELYALDNSLAWVPMTADLRSGQAPLYDHDEVWAEIDAEEARAESPNIAQNTPPTDPKLGKLGA